MLTRLGAFMVSHALHALVKKSSCSLPTHPSAEDCIHNPLYTNSHGDYEK